LSNNELINSAFYDIYAINKNGIIVHSFAHPITIVLPISQNQRDLENPGLYWLNETNWKWVLIPDAIFTEDKVVFKVDHLTRFAIFARSSKAGVGKGGGGTSVSNLKPSIPLPQDKKGFYMRSTSTKPTPINISNFDKSKGASKGGVLWFFILIIVAFIAIIWKRKSRN
jgi:hypothetical protein